MTGNAIKAKSEALELHELSFEELDAVSGGETQAELNAQREAQYKAFDQANMTFAQMLAKL